VHVLRSEVQAKDDEVALDNVQHYKRFIVVLQPRQDEKYCQEHPTHVGSPVRELTLGFFRVDPNPFPSIVYG
jgi:hypothetical protein